MQIRKPTPLLDAKTEGSEREVAWGAGFRALGFMVWALLNVPVSWAETRIGTTCPSMIRSVADHRITVLRPCGRRRFLKAQIGPQLIASTEASRLFVPLVML